LRRSATVPEASPIVGIDDEVVMAVPPVGAERGVAGVNTGADAHIGRELLASTEFGPTMCRRRPHVAQICDLDAEMRHVGIGEIPNRFNECLRIVFGTRTDEAKRLLPKHRPVRASSCCSAFLNF